MPKISYKVTLAPQQDKFGLHKTETGDCVLATINDENNFTKFEQTLKNDVSEVVSIFKYETSDKETRILTNSGNIKATDVKYNGKPLFYKSIKTPVLNHDIYLDGELCYQDNYFVYTNVTQGSFDYYDKTTGNFSFTAFHECVPVFLWNLFDNLTSYYDVDDRTYYLKKDGDKIRIIFSKPNVIVEKLEEQVYHPCFIDDYCLYFSPFIFSTSRTYAGKQYICNYDYTAIQPRKRFVNKEFVEDKFENYKLKNRYIYPEDIEIYFESIYDYFDSFTLNINHNNVQLYLGQVDVSKIAKEYGVDISKYNAYVSYYYLDLPELKYLIDDVVSQYSGVEGYTYQAFFYPTRIAYEKHVIEYPKTFTIEQGDATLSEHKIFQSSLSGPIGYTYSGNRVMSYGEYNDAYVFKYETGRRLFSSSSVALAKFNAEKSNFDIVYNQFKIPIIKRVNVFSISKFDYIINENPFLITGDYKFTDIRNFADTILISKSNAIQENSLLKNWQTDYNLQFTTGIFKINGFNSYPLNFVVNNQVTSGWDNRFIFYSNYDIDGILRACQHDLAHVEDPKNSIDYWLLKLTRNEVEDLERFNIGYKKEAFNLANTSKNDFQLYAGQELLESLLKIFIVYAEINNEWVAIDNPEIKIMKNDVHVQILNSQKITKAKLGLKYGDDIWI